MIHRIEAAFMRRWRSLPVIWRAVVVVVAVALWAYAHWAVLGPYLF